MEDSTLLLAGCMTLNKPFHPCWGDDHKSLRSELRVRVSFGEHLEFLSLGPADISVGLIPVVETPWAREGLERPSWPHPMTQQ